MPSSGDDHNLEQQRHPETNGGIQTVTPNSKAVPDNNGVAEVGKLGTVMLQKLIQVVVDGLTVDGIRMVAKATINQKGVLHQEDEYETFRLQARCGIRLPASFMTSSNQTVGICTPVCSCLFFFYGVCGGKLVRPLPGLTCDLGTIARGIAGAPKALLLLQPRIGLTRDAYAMEEKRPKRGHHSRRIAHHTRNIYRASRRSIYR